MTQQTTDELPISQQKYRRIDSLDGFYRYSDARETALRMFRSLTETPISQEIVDLTTEKHKVRVKRRTKWGNEYFDVISYERIEVK